MKVKATSNAVRVAAENKARAIAFNAEFYKTLNAAQGPIKQSAVSRSMGAIPTKTLVKPPPGLNNPYGIGPSNKRGLRGAQPYGGLPIWNKQKGTVAGDWMTSIGFRSDRAHVRLFNINPISFWLNFGTKKMRQRDILKAVHADRDQWFTNLMVKAFKKAYGIP